MLSSRYPGPGASWSGLLAPYVPAMTQPLDDNLDHHALGYYALGKGLGRQDCPYAEGTEPHAQWTAGYDEAVKQREGGQGEAE